MCYAPQEPRVASENSLYLTPTARPALREVISFRCRFHPRDDQGLGDLAASERTRLTDDCTEPIQS